MNTPPPSVIGIAENKPLRFWVNVGITQTEAGWSVSVSKHRDVETPEAVIQWLRRQTFGNAEVAEAANEAVEKMSKQDTGFAEAAHANTLEAL